MGMQDLKTFQEQVSVSAITYETTQEARALMCCILLMVELISLRILGYPFQAKRVID